MEKPSSEVDGGNAVSKDEVVLAELGASSRLCRGGQITSV